MQLYIKLAILFNIIDKPNERSLHTEHTIRGGGIIFPVVYFLSTIIYPSLLPPIPLTIGLFLVSFISLLDDIYTLPSRYRLVIHMLAILLCFVALQLFSGISVGHIFLLVILLIVAIGILNAYNFMDGINGITGLYSLITLTSLYYIYHELGLEYQMLILHLSVACVIFLWYNFRQKARCFAGDVGSISMAFLLIFFLGFLIIHTQQWKYILMLFVYGVDTIYTILYRIRLKENIFKAHKFHLFQLLTYDYHLPHRQVSLMYAAVQLLLNIWLLATSSSTWYFYMPYLFILLLVHLLRAKKHKALTSFPQPINK